MAKYRFKAKDLNNKIIKGVFFAKDEDDLREIVSHMDYYLIKSSKVAESSQLFAFLEKIKVSELALFCRQLAIMLESGMALSDAIEILKSNSKVPKLKSILEVVHHDLLQGIMLSESLAKYPKTFPVFFRNMIHIGEISGKLVLVLRRLADYYEKDNRTKRKVRSALAYPIFLLCMCFAILAVLALYVMPIFKKVFDDLEAELPQITITVMNVSDFIQKNFSLILMGGLLIFLIFWLLLKNKKFRKDFDQFKLTQSFTRELTLATITSRFTSGFSTLLSSSIPIIDALSIMAKLLGNTFVEDRMQVTISEIKRGQGIAKSLETINIFPPILIEMISVGEQTGQLEEVLNSITAYYEEQVDYAIKKVTAAIEPIMIIAIGLIVVVVLLSIFMPMLDITKNIQPAAGV